ncbi:MAG: hypothetical protein WDZ42_02390 [Candidatus Saccharimonadales bacterium]
MKRNIEQALNIYRYKNTIVGLLLLIYLAVFVITAAYSVIAQENNNTNGGQGLSISPPLISLEVDPGESVELDITLRNITSRDMTVRGEVNDFVARDESGEPMILLDDDQDSPYSLKRFIANIPELQIAEGEQVVATVPLVIPENASPGAYMGVVRFSAVSSDTDSDGSQVSLSASVGTLVLANVSGDVDSNLEVEELAVSQHDNDSQELTTKLRSTDKSLNSGIIEKGPLTAIVRLNNLGNIYLQPQGSFGVTNIFGREVNIASDDEGNPSSVLEFNADKRNVLPESIRRFEYPIDKNFWFGRYTLTVDVDYGPDQDSVSESLSFWVIPYKLLAIAILALALLVLFGRKGLKMYNQRIVNKFHETQQATTDKKS